MNPFLFLMVNITLKLMVLLWDHLGPTLDLLLMLFSVCPVKRLPNVYKGYFDGIFVTFSSYSQLLKFVDYMNHQHPYIKFTSVVEKTKTSHFYMSNIPLVVYLLTLMVLNL